MSFLTATLSLAVCALVAVFPGPGEAGAPLTLNSALAASSVEPQQATIAIAADRDKTPISTAKLQFRLQPLPQDVVLKVCAMRFVMADAIPEGVDNGVLLQLVDPVQPDRAVAAINVPPGTPKNTAIILRSEALCDALQKPVARKAADQRDLARFELKTTIRDGRVRRFRRDGPSGGCTPPAADLRSPERVSGRRRLEPSPAGRPAQRAVAMEALRSGRCLHADPVRRCSGQYRGRRGQSPRRPQPIAGVVWRRHLRGPRRRAGRLSAHRVRPLRPDAQRGDAERDAEVPRRGERAPVRRHRKQDFSLSTVPHSPPTQRRSPSGRARQYLRFRRAAPTVPFTLSPVNRFAPIRRPGPSCGATRPGRTM